MRRTVSDFRDETGRVLTMLRNLARRAVVTGASVATWAISGFTDGEGNEEADDAEVFQGVGFASRPATGNNVECVVVNVGATPNHPVIVATRDLDGFKAIIGSLEPGEVAIFDAATGKTVKLTAAGEVRLGAPAAAVEALVRGTTYRAAEDTLLTALQTWMTATSVALGTIAAFVDPAKSTYTAATTAATAAVNTFKAAAATYLSTVSKTE